MHYQWWHMDPYMMNSQRMHYHSRNPRKIRRRPPWDTSSNRSHLGTAYIADNKNKSKPDFETIVSNAFELHNIQDSDLKKALTKALEQAVDYDQIYQFVHEKIKSDKRHDDVHFPEHAPQKDRHLRTPLRPSPSAPEGSWLEPPKHVS